MNQNIMLNSENLTGHAKGKFNRISLPSLVVELEQNAVCRNIFCDSRMLFAFIQDNNGKRQRKPDRATDLLPHRRDTKDRRRRC